MRQWFWENFKIDSTLTPYVCINYSVIMCMCVRERERGREKEKERVNINTEHPQQINSG